MRLAEMTDFATENLAGGRFVCVSCIDTDGASDTVPHDKLTQALRERGVEAHYVRFIARWLAGGRFKLRLRAPTGYYFNHPRAMGRGLPHGGVPSPLLWLLVFNQIQPRLEAAREGEPEIFMGVGRIYLIYADDVPTILSHEDPVHLARAATENAQPIQQILDELGLKLSVPKSYNFAASPSRILG